MRELAGKVAVVTGAASGIGRAMVERFARERMKVVLADVEEKPLAELNEALRRGGTETLAVRTDVSRWEDVAELARRTFEAFGTAHLVCNNAGVSGGGLAWELTEADWTWVLGVNLWGVVHGVRAFVPRLVQQGEGHVVNTASIAGLTAAPAMAAYCASKHAVVGISECLHYDLALIGSPVKVSVVCPAWVRTQISDSERNRPSSLPAPDASSRAPQAQMIHDTARAAVSRGIAPADVADTIWRAITEEHFWVITHPKMKKTIERRVRNIVEDRNPEFKFDPNKL
jgi:NAD(P)-dependent dehydrogenase (short-subunit alcohol dehydrogenase family)